MEGGRDREDERMKLEVKKRREVEAGAIVAKALKKAEVKMLKEAFKAALLKEEQRRRAARKVERALLKAAVLK